MVLINQCNQTIISLAEIKWGDISEDAPNHSNPLVTTQLHSL